ALSCGADPELPEGGQGGQSSETASFKVRGSVEQIDVWKAPPATKIEVHDASGALVASGTTDEQGSLVLRKIPAGDAYAVTAPSMAAPNTTKPARVVTVEASLPKTDFYTGQKLTPGYNYITTRDGTQLAAYITLPGPIEKGPYPTVVNYS